MIEKIWFEEDSLKRIHTKKRIQYREHTFRHHSTRLEMELLRYVATGNVEEIRKHIDDPLDGEWGITSKSGPLRNAKNVFIASLATVIDMVIREGMNTETVYTLADAYIEAAEALDSEDEVIALGKRMFIDFTARMKQLRENRYSKPVAKTVDYIEQNLEQDLSVPTLARHVYLSPNYLSKLFKKETGSTIALFVQEKRIDEAAKMLKFTEYSILDICLFLRFRNQSYFTRVFRERTGTTPGRYRRLGGRD